MHKRRFVYDTILTALYAGRQGWRLFDVVKDGQV
jgi:hypothetical protein